MKYYILDNGSTDQTGDLIQKYSEKDSRIHFFQCSENFVWGKEVEGWINLCKSISDDDYICWLDSDDYYEDNFLEKMISFMESNGLDIAACGSKFIDARDNRVICERILKYPLIISKPEEFSNFFSVYHQFMRPMW